MERVATVINRLAVGRLAVLRGVDQRAGRAPRRCVKSGVPTDRAVHVHAAALGRAELVQLVVGHLVTRLVASALRRPSMRVTIAVSPGAWRRWRRSRIVPTLAGAGGAGLLFGGIAAGSDQAIAVGVVAVLVGWLLGVRAARRWWIGARCRPARDEIVVTRVSAGFADEARSLFSASVLGR